jgi:hypothetical protein
MVVRVGKEPTRQSCSFQAMQLLPGENNDSSDHLAQTGSELAQSPIANCPGERRNKILLTSQSPGETILELLLITNGP